MPGLGTIFVMSSRRAVLTSGLMRPDPRCNLIIGLESLSRWPSDPAWQIRQRSRQQSRQLEMVLPVTQRSDVIEQFLPLGNLIRLVYWFPPDDGPLAQDRHPKLVFARHSSKSQELINVELNVIRRPLYSH